MDPLVFTLARLENQLIGECARTPRGGRLHDSGEWHLPQLSTKIFALAGLLAAIRARIDLQHLPSLGRLVRYV